MTHNSVVDYPIRDSQSVRNKSRIRRATTRKPVMTNDVFATPKVVAKQKIEGHSSQELFTIPSGKKNPKIRPNQAIREITFKIAGFLTSQTQWEVFTGS